MDREMRIDLEVGLVCLILTLLLTGCRPATETYYEVPVLSPSPTVGSIIRVGADTVLHVACYTHTQNRGISCVRY